MPIYEYQCDKCHKRTSVLTMRVSERVEAVCEHCGSARMRRLMGEAGRRTIDREYSIERLVSRIEKLLLTLLAAKDSETRGRRFLARGPSEGR